MGVKWTHGNRVSKYVPVFQDKLLTGAPLAGQPSTFDRKLSSCPQLSDWEPLLSVSQPSVPLLRFHPGQLPSLHNHFTNVSNIPVRRTTVIT